MINKRKFLSNLKDYNDILGVLISHLDLTCKEGQALIDHKDDLPGNIREFCTANSPQLAALRTEYLEDLKEDFYIHSNFGDLNRLNRVNFEPTLLDPDWRSNLIRKINAFLEPIGNLSNTVIFRHIKIGDRRISIINQALPDSVQAKFKQLQAAYARDMYRVYDKFYLSNSEFAKSITGFIRGKSYVEHARDHIDCKSAISVDVSRFYDSINLNGIVRNRLFYNSLISSYELKTGVKFAEESFTNPIHYEVMQELFGLLNVAFITLMSFYTHNGILPTGASYSPIISNILFASLDSSILASLQEGHRYTRYADDICVSTTSPYAVDGSFTLNIDTIKGIESVANGAGFFLNYDKTSIMGPRDRKKIAGIIIDSSGEEPRLSIGSSKKLKLKQEFEGKDWDSLTSSDKGTIEWVRSINLSQYNFILSGIENVPTEVITKGAVMSRCRSHPGSANPLCYELQRGSRRNSRRTVNLPNPIFPAGPAGVLHYEDTNYTEEIPF